MSRAGDRTPPGFAMNFTSADKRGAGAFDGSQRERDRKSADSPLEGTGFELVWGFPCQVVFFGLLPVLCSEAEGAVLDPVAYDQVPRARAMGSRDRNASKAWRLAALAALVFGSALTPEHAEGR